MMAGTRLLVAVLVAGALGCGKDPAAGSKGGPCYWNGSCDGVLVCLSNLCVPPTSGTDVTETSVASDSSGEADDPGATVKPKVKLEEGLMKTIEYFRNLPSLISHP